MKYILASLLFSITFLSGCTDECRPRGDTTKQFVFLSRDGLGGTGIRSTYADNLIVDKCNALNLSISEYMAIARNYVDTVHADVPVASVTFYGVDLKNPEIYPGSSNMLDYALIDISFDFNDNEKKIVTAKSKILSLALWKEGQDYNKEFYETSIVTMNKGKMTIVKQEERKGRIFLDSLANSRVPLKKIWKTID